MYVTADSFPSQEATEEEFSSSANFKIRNRVVTTFSPKLVFDKEIANSKLSSAKILVSARPKVEQTLTINADAQASVDAIRTVLKKRDFRKIYVTPAGIPIVISGSFKIDLHIEGEATGKMTATERLEIGYDEVTFGVEYVNGQFHPVKSATPVYELKIGGEANAQANLKLTLLPSLELTAYEVLTGNVVLAPYMQATAGIEGKVSLDARVDFEADRLRTAADADYRLTAARLQGGLDTYLYADLSVWDFTLAKYPNKDAEKGKYDTYQKVTLIDDTTLMDLPTLSVQVPELASGSASAAHPTDTRALKIVAIAANVPNPLHALFPGLPASYTPWRAWTAPKIVDQIDIDKSTYRVVGDGAEWSDVAWATFTVPGTYTLRVGGYSAWGPWARQYVETTVEIKDDNANTIMDFWEERYGLQGTGEAIAQGDPDRDGQSNLKEWQDGTDPRVPNGPTLSDATLVASKQALTLGEQFQVWISQTWDAVVRVVYTIGDETATVLRKATDTLERAFQAIGKAAEAGTFTMMADLYDSTNAKVGSTSLELTVNPATVVAVTISSAYDDRATPNVGVPQQGITEDATPVIRGTIGAPLGAGYEVRLFKDGETDSFGVATVDGLNWSYTVPADQPLSNGVHSITAGVVRAVDGSTEPGPRSAPYSFTVQAVGVFDVEPKQVMRAKSTVFTFSGQGLPTSGLTITAPGNSRNTCQINAAGNSATGFNATCSFFTLGAQTLQISQGSRVLGTLELDVTSNITDVSWASGSSTTFGKGTVKFGEMVTYRVSGEHLLVDTNLGFAVERCGVANTEIGTGTDVLRTYQCWFNNEAGAVAGQMSGVVKDAPNGQALYNFQVPVETAPIDANSSIVVSWDLGSVGTPIQGRGTNPRTVAINAGLEIEGFLNGPAFDVDVSNDRVRLFNFRNYAGYPGSAVFDASAFNGLVLRVPSGASWTFTSASVGSANTLSGLAASRLDAQAQRLAINLAGMGYDANTVVEVAYSRNVSGSIELPATAFVRGVNVALSTNGYGSDTLMNAPPYLGVLNAAEWDFVVPVSGVYELRSTYATVDPRPVNISINGLTVFSAAMSSGTGGFFPVNRMTFSEGSVYLSAGSNVMRVAGNGVVAFPHIKGFSFVGTSASALQTGTFSVAANNASGTKFTGPAGSTSCAFHAVGEWSGGASEGMWSADGNRTKATVAAYPRIFGGAPYFSLIAKTSSGYEFLGVSKTLPVVQGQVFDLMINEGIGIGDSYVDNTGVLTVGFACTGS